MERWKKLALRRFMGGSSLAPLLGGACCCAWASVAVESPLLKKGEKKLRRETMPLL
jgi:hypothetical protein